MNKKPKSKLKIFLGVIAILILGMGVFSVVYVNDYYHATDKESDIASTQNVIVKQTDTGYMFDGAGTDTALVFYPGAKVEDISYAPILKSLAENGVDCFVVHMPCNLALFGINKMDKVMQEYNYEHWYIAGHSLGGAMASSYAYKNSDKLDGIIFLASYSTKDLSNTDLKVLSLYGSEDKVLNMDKVYDTRKYMPESYEEYCIQGGNHAGYAEYGKQKGDGEATITSQEQQSVAVDKILETIKK